MEHSVEDRNTHPQVPQMTETDTQNKVENDGLSGDVFDPNNAVITVSGKNEETCVNLFLKIH